MSYLLMGTGSREANCWKKSSLQDDLFSRESLLHIINNGLTKYVTVPSGYKSSHELETVNK